MTKAKRYFGKHCLIIVYFSLVYPYLIYGRLLQRNNYDSPLSQLILLQNKAVRITNDTPLRDPISPCYVNSGLPKCRDDIKLQTCLFIYIYIFFFMSIYVKISQVTSSNSCV